MKVKTVKSHSTIKTENMPPSIVSTTADDRTLNVGIEDLSSQKSRRKETATAVTSRSREGMYINNSPKPRDLHFLLLYG